MGEIRKSFLSLLFIKQGKMSDQKIKLGITLGDVNGIGPEVVIKMLSDSRIWEMFTPVVYGAAKVLAYYKKDIEGAENLQFTTIKNAAEARSKRVNLVSCIDEETALEPGTSKPEAGKAAVEMLRAAAADLKAGTIDAIVTAPINKENVQAEGFKFTGHTEFFASEFGGEPLMMMCSQLLKVGLVTIHIPVAEVSKNITADKMVAPRARLRRSRIADFGIVEPKIAVLALQPHAGDGGLLGEEEEKIIKPAIVEAGKNKVLAFGPFPADGFFAAAGYDKYDAVLAMYHDQGLVPFKTLTPEGVNFTAGLSVVRTSPDHGVAYDIAGQGKADPASMREAAYMAMDILQCRKNYAEMTKNPLQHFERERGGRDLSVKDLKLPEQSDND